VAAEVANITPAQHYCWFEKDPAYRRDFEYEQEMVVGGLQDEVVELAVQGRLAPVFYRGQQCGTVRQYSDRLLRMLLKAWKPEKYR
jgi:hypothetical protein